MRHGAALGSRLWHPVINPRNNHRNGARNTHRNPPRNRLSRSALFFPFVSLRSAFCLPVTIPFSPLLARPFAFLTHFATSFLGFPSLLVSTLPARNPLILRCFAVFFACCCRVLSSPTRASLSFSFNFAMLCPFFLTLAPFLLILLIVSQPTHAGSYLKGCRSPTSCETLFSPCFLWLC